MRTYTDLQALLFSLFILLAPSYYAKSQDQRPNIIFVMADDMGCADLSSFGRTDFQTPNLDAFVKSGMKFTNAYAGAPVCTPTRVAFMTGRYPARNAVGLREPLTGSPDDNQLGLSPSTPTVSSLLKKNGYETALFGKWHLGIGSEYSPLKHGFDNFFGILSGAADYIDHRQVDRTPTHILKRDRSLLYENEDPVKKKGYLTDLITEYATRFIKQKHNKPFFISIQYTSPHWPWQVPNDQPVADSIPFSQVADPGTYQKMITNLDENFGKILNALRENGLEGSTLIIFTSDNGGDRLANMGPYKGGKLQLWEGGLRVPAAVRWPAKIPAGQESNQPVITMDWTVTILDAAATKYNAINFDGISLLSHFKHPDKIVPRKFYWRLSNRGSAEAYRSGDWKYLHVRGGEFLFNLRDDPFEDTDLKSKMNSKFNELKAEFLKVNAEMLPPLVLAQ